MQEQSSKQKGEIEIAILTALLGHGGDSWRAVGCRSRRVAQPQDGRASLRRLVSPLLECDFACTGLWRIRVVRTE